MKYRNSLYFFFSVWDVDAKNIYIEDGTLLLGL